MKIRSRRLMAVLLSAAMALPVPAAAYAESAGSSAAEVQAAAAQEEQTAAPETQASSEPQTQAQTAAPETQAPSEPQTQAQTAAPETQAPSEPQTQAQTAAPETQVPSSEPQTQAPTSDLSAQPAKQKESESSPETESESGKTKSAFEAKASGVSVKVVLPKGKKLSADTAVSLKITKGKDDKRQAQKVRAALEKSERIVSGIRFITVRVTDGKGQNVKLPKETRLAFSFADGLDLGLGQRREGEVRFLAVSDKAADAGADIRLSGDGLRMTSAEVSLKNAADGNLSYAAAGIQNYGGKSGAVSADTAAGLASVSGYPVIGADYQGPENDSVLDGSAEDENRKKAQDLLDSLASASLKLADAKTSESVRVVNLYADDDGEVSADYAAETDPMYGVREADGSVSVTSGYVVVNIVAEDAGQSIRIPALPEVYEKDGAAEAVTAESHAEYAGHLIVNVVAGNGKSGSGYGFVPFTGSADADGDAVGVYLAPAGTLSFSGDLTGSAYAQSISVGGKLTPSVSGEKMQENPDEADETEPQTGEVSAEGENGTEEGQTEAGRTNSPDGQTEVSSEMSGTVQEQTDPGKTGTGADALAGGAQMLAKAARLQVPEESAEEAEAGSADADATQTENAGNAFDGTLQVNAVWSDAPQNPQTSQLPGVLFSLYEKNVESGTAGTMVYSWASGDSPVSIPSGILKAGKSYIVREEAMPRPEEGQTQWMKLPESTFKIDDTEGKRNALVWRGTDGNGGTFSGPSGDNSSEVYTLTYTHTEKRTSSAAYYVNISSADMSGRPVPGAEVTITKQDGGGTDEGSKSRVAAFTTQGTDITYDFGDLLEAEKQQGKNTVKVSVKETAPAGMYLADEESVRVIIFTFDSEKPGWKYEIRGEQGKETVPIAGRDYAETGETGGSADPVDVGTITFRNAYQAALSSDQIPYSDNPEDPMSLAGGTIQIFLNENTVPLTAGTDYRILDSGGNVYYTASSSPGDGFTMPGSPVRIVLLNGAAVAGSSVRVVGIRDDGYHYTAGGASASGKISGVNRGENGTYAAAVPTLALHSRANATVHVSSYLKDGTAHLSVASDAKKTVRVRVAGSKEVEIRPNPASAVLSSADTDDAVAEMLAAGITAAKENREIETNQIIGVQNWENYIFSPANAVITSAKEDPQTGAVTIEAKLTSTANVTDGTIAVQKEIYRASTGKKLYLSAQKDFQVRVFADEAADVPVTAAKKLTVSRNNTTSGSTGRVSFTLPVDVVSGTTYYVYEVDESGRPVRSGSDLTVTASGGDKSAGDQREGAAVTLKAQQLSASNLTPGQEARYSVPQRVVTIRNTYSDSYINTHSEFMLSGSFDIQLRVVDAQGRELPADNLVAEFRVRDGARKLALRNNQKITLRNASSGTRKGISFPLSGSSGAMSVTLMSIRTTGGVSLASQYTLLTASYDNQFSRAGARTGERTFTLKADAENQGPVVFVLRKNETNEKASLTLTKSVMYKKTPIRVNATYYIGIFSDPQHRHLLFRKAMTLKDASSMSDTLKVNVNSQKNRSVTLYFAETDRNGKVVESGKKTGYDISVSPSQVTLSAPSSANPNGNMSATVTVTNEIRDGSRAAQRLTDPSSGFAGDSAALADAQALAAGENLNSRTGDTTPLTRYIVLIVLAAAAICAVLAVMAARRRKK